MHWPAFVLGVVLVATGLYVAVKNLNTKTNDALEAEFEHFIAKWGKSYTKEERESRFATFKDNYAFVMAENAKGHKYTLAVNEFADMTADEFGATHMSLWKPEKMWGDLPYLGQHNYSGAALPSSLDWSQKGAVTPVKNQGQCGSCWSFSTTGSLEGAWEIATGNLVSLSEQQFVDCSKQFGNMGCNGGLMDNAFKYAVLNGLCTEESYPYKAKSGTCEASSCTTGIPKGGVTGFKDVHPEDLQAMEEAVAQQPVSIAIEADQMTFQLYHSGVLTGKCGTKLDHGVLAVGYGTVDGTDYWKVKNSWGPSWGKDGYILLEKGKNKAGECGIKMQPSYPVVSGKPGPSPPPSPSPPSPPSPPTPPGPSGKHYEKPPCQEDEVERKIDGFDGSFCAPQCDGTDGSCPKDVPDGTIARPMCTLADDDGNNYCALECISDEVCPYGMKCANPDQGFLGICVYPDSKASLKTLHMMKKPKQPTIVI